MHAKARAVFEAATIKRQELETCSSEWKQYEHYAAMVEESLNLIQNVNVASLNLFNIKNVISSCDFNLRNLHSKEKEMGELNKYAEVVMAKGDATIKELVASHHQVLTQR